MWFESKYSFMYNIVWHWKQFKAVIILFDPDLSTYTTQLKSIEAALFCVRV